MSEVILSLKDVTFEAEGRKILDGVSLEIQKGEMVTIIGPSGSGKSTLLKVISSMISPTSGKIIYKGGDIEEISPIDYRKEVSYFFQNAVLFGETVKENMAFPYEIRGKEFEQDKAETYLQMVRLPKAYLTKAIKDLSGGEKQRVALIRNMMFMPEILVLDEVTSSLDSENSEIILSLVKKINTEEKCTVLWVTHKEEEIRQADRVLEVKNGGVVERERSESATSH